MKQILDRRQLGQEYFLFMFLKTKNIFDNADCIAHHKRINLLENTIYQARVEFGSRRKRTLKLSNTKKEVLSTVYPCHLLSHARANQRQFYFS